MRKVLFMLPLRYGNLHLPGPIHMRACAAGVLWRPDAAHSALQSRRNPMAQTPCMPPIGVLTPHRRANPLRKPTLAGLDIRHSPV